MFDFKVYLERVKSNPIYATYTRQKKYRGFKDKSAVKLDTRIRKEEVLVASLFKTPEEVADWTPQVSFV